MVNPLLRTEIIEVAIGNGAASEFSLGSLPNLREAKTIRRIEAFHAGQITFSPSGRAVVNTAVFQRSYIKLINRDNLEFRIMALSSLSKTVNGSAIENIHLPQIDPEKSKVTIGGVAAGVVAGEVFLLEVTYEKVK